MRKREKEIVIGSDNYSGLGYFYMAVKDSHLFDVMKIQASKYFWHLAEVVITYLTLNGWQECEVTRFEVKEVRSRCKQCRKNYKGQVNKCTECGGDCKEYSFDAHCAVLEKTGVFQAHQEEMLAKKETKEILLYVQAEKNRHVLKDKIILRRWG